MNPSAGEAEPGRTQRLAGRPGQLRIQAVVREAARNSRKLAVKGPWREHGVWREILGRGRTAPIECILTHPPWFAFL